MTRTTAHVTPLAYFRGKTMSIHGSVVVDSKHQMGRYHWVKLQYTVMVSDKLKWMGG